MIAHRSRLNNQFIPYYDEASSRWFDMVENETIPLTGNRKEVRRSYVERMVRDLMDATGIITEEEERMLQQLEEEEWNQKMITLQTLNQHVHLLTRKKFIKNIFFLHCCYIE